MVSAIITCAGNGERAGFNKLLKDIGGVTPFERSLSAFSSCGVIDEIIITCRKQDEEVFRQKAERLGVSPLFIEGGKTRALSVKAGVSAAKGDIVIIHDGARPFVDERIIKDCVLSAKEYGSGVAAIPSTDTVLDCEEENGEIFSLSSSRKDKYLAQTPQAFKTSVLLKAYESVADVESFTDESGIFSAYTGKCKVVKGSSANKKLTFKEDFAAFGNYYCGTGFDLHRLAENRKLILGGVEIPHDKGLLGHSDADALTHAIMDAMLSSASMGDIGKFFPDTDERYKGISSMLLLKEVKKLLEKNGYKLINVTAVIMAQKPKLMPFVPKIKANLAAALGICESGVGITCTTLEGIGIVGREEGIAVQAYVLTEKTNG